MRDNCGLAVWAGPLHDSLGWQSGLAVWAGSLGWQSGLAVQLTFKQWDNRIMDLHVYLLLLQLVVLVVLVAQLTEMIVVIQTCASLAWCTSLQLKPAHVRTEHQC